MPQLPAKPSLSEADFETIASAVKETERGRWFLDEYARRNRHADTRQVLEAIEKLQHSFSSRGEATQEDSIRLTIADMADAIAKTKAEISAIKPSEESQGKIGDATVELDAIVSTTEQATSEILAAAEQVQEIAWTLREQGTEAPVCDKLDELMTQTYTACSFQDLTGQRIRKIVNVLNFLEARIEAMNLIWGKHETPAAEPAETPSMEASLLNGPALPGQGLQQFAVDELIDPAEAKAQQAKAAEADEDIVWEDTPLDEAQEAPMTKAAVQAPPVNEVAEVEIEEETALLAPVTPAPQPAKAAMHTPDPIQSLSPVEKLALFS